MIDTIPTTWTEIRTAGNDRYAPDARIGWIAPTEQANPNDQWIAIFPDLDDATTDSQPVKSWSEPVRTAEDAEAKVRTNYAHWAARQG